MSKEIIVTFDGNEISAELGKGWPSGAKAEKEAEKFLKGRAIKDKVGHRPHVHTPEGTVVYTG